MLAVVVDKDVFSAVFSLDLTVVWLPDVLDERVFSAVFNVVPTVVGFSDVVDEEDFSAVSNVVLTVVWLSDVVVQAELISVERVTALIEVENPCSLQSGSFGSHLPSKLQVTTTFFNDSAHCTSNLLPFPPGLGSRSNSKFSHSTTVGTLHA